MPTSSTFSVIYLGQFDSIDPVESGYLSENAASLLNRDFDDFTQASVQTFSPGSYDSYDGNGNLTYNYDNDRGTDTFNITDADGNTTQHGMDAGVTYNAVLTFADGSTETTRLVVIQDVDGNTWIAPPSRFVPDAALLGGQPIQGVRLTGISDDSYFGLYYDREVGENIETVPCFTAGTMIRTPESEIPVEALSTGDLVMTRDNGPQPVRWVGAAPLDAASLAAAPALRPIRIEAGALGPGNPAADLIVSPQHRVLVRSRIAQRMFGTDEVLVAAKQLVMLSGINIDRAAEGVCYHHFMCDRHEVVYSNGAETETLYAGDQALKSISPEAKGELFALFPQLRGFQAPLPARLLISGRKGRKLAMRHRQNRANLQPRFEAQTEGRASA